LKTCGGLKSRGRTSRGDEEGAVVSLSSAAHSMLLDSRPQSAVAAAKSLIATGRPSSRPLRGNSSPGNAQMKRRKKGKAGEGYRCLYPRWIAMELRCPLRPLYGRRRGRRARSGPALSLEPCGSRGAFTPLLYARFLPLCCTTTMIFSRAAARACRWSERRSLASLPRPRRYTNFAASKFLQVSEEIQDAVATGKPVVALETTIYTHGAPSSLCP